MGSRWCPIYAVGSVASSAATSRIGGIGRNQTSDETLAVSTVLCTHSTATDGFTNSISAPVFPPTAANVVFSRYSLAPCSPTC